VLWVTSIDDAALSVRSEADRRRVLVYLALFGTVILWGLGPPLSKKITGTPTTIVAVRLWMAIPATMLVQRLSGSRPSLRSIRKAWLGGALFAINMLFFFSALRHVTVATLTLIGVLQPVVISLVSVKLFGEKLSRWWAIWTTVAIAGVAVAVLAAGKSLRADPFGLVLALGTVLAFSVYLLVARRAREHMSSAEYLTGVMTWAAAFLTIPLFFQGLRLYELGRGDFGWLLLVLLGPGMLGHLLMNWVIPKLPMNITSLQMLPSTVVSIAAAWPMHHEHITLLQALAGLVTLTAIGLVVHGPFTRPARL
jgi:drug/metabolite transporter (DMT)-like permease